MKIEVNVDLPDTKMKKIEDKHLEIIIEVETTESSTECRTCGKIISKRHGCDRERRLRHTSVFGKRSYIVYTPHRYYCEDCDCTTTSTPIWHDRNSNHTTGYDNNLLLLLVNSTLSDVAIKEGLTEATVQGVLDRLVATSINWFLVSYIGTLGIDEITLRKGRSDYVTLITSRHNGVMQILAVIDGRKKADIVAFLRSIPKKLTKTIDAICTDMCDGYVYAVKKVFKRKTLLVIDRYHVAKLYRGEVDKYRQKILAQLKATLPQSEYDKLKGSMHILRGNNECLSKEEKTKLEELFSHSPELMDAYRLALKLTQLFNTHMTKEEAIIKLNTWIKEVKQSGLPCFNTFLKTIKKYKNEISNYFIERKNSGFVEGFNNKVKVLKRRCYGLSNLKHLFQRLHLDLSGYRFLLGISAC